MKITPLGDRILVTPDPEKETTEGGIVLPGGSNLTNYFTGTVGAVGEKVTKVKGGERVMYLKYGYDMVRANGTDLHLVEEASLLAIFEE